jgi:hypothetical protein
MSRSGPTKRSTSLTQLTAATFVSRWRIYGEIGLCHARKLAHFLNSSNAFSRKLSRATRSNSVVSLMASRPPLARHASLRMRSGHVVGGWKLGNETIVISVFFVVFCFFFPFCFYSWMEFVFFFRCGRSEKIVFCFLRARLDISRTDGFVR